MLSATQIGNVPAEVKSAQRELLALAEEVRRSWPPNQTEYRSDDVRKVVTSLNRSVAKLVESVSLAVQDPLIAESEGLVAQANRGNAELQKLQRALAIPAEQSRQAATVDLPAFKGAIPAAMIRVAQVWGDLNTLHRVSLGWIGGTQADIMVQGYRDVLAAVQGMPGAKKIGFVGRHRKKIAIGVVAVAASGAGTWWILRRRRTMMLQAPEMDAPEEDLEIPVGIHFLPEGNSKLAKASELVNHIARPDELGAPSFALRDLPRGMREEMFNLHATSVNPDATERAFAKKRVPVRDVSIAKIDVSSYKDEDYFGKQDLASLPPIVIADGKLIDGGHRVAAAQRKGIKTLRAIDMTGLLDPDSTGSIAELRRAGKLGGEQSALPPGFEPFDVDYDAPRKTKPECGEHLSAMRRGDVVQVGGSRWEVTHARGTDVLVIKHGTKGRKLYKLVTVSLDPCEVEVQEVHPGSGDIMHNVAPSARGALGD